MTRREISAGCVIYRISAETIDVVLIQPRERAAWSLPKGLVERGETSQQAAQREAREETGLYGQILSRIDTIKYSYIAKWENPPVRIFKIVTFYLLQFEGGDFSLHDSEVERVDWFEIDDAIRTASYGQEKEVLKKALKLIRENGAPPE